ncbi:MAG: DUF2065 domain-containing protein [Pseudomonadota bacterium]|nr:DUF2065 domain-containing protein [Pseudomonadota bacterium]
MIEKLFFAFASVLVFEGCVLAIIPSRVRKVLAYLVNMSDASISKIGLVTMVLGLICLSVIEI